MAVELKNQSQTVFAFDGNFIAKLQAAIKRHEKKNGKLSNKEKRELFHKIESKTNKETDKIIHEALPGARTKVQESMQRVDHETS